MDKMPITVTGFERLQEELKHLKSSERPAVIKAIAEARYRAVANAREEQR